MPNPHSLKRGSTVVYIVEGDGEFRGYFGTCLGHDGDFQVTKLKVTSGENFASSDNRGYLVQNGINYFQDIPHGDPSQGGTWVWPDEVPADFYVG